MSNVYGDVQLTKANFDTHCTILYNATCRIIHADIYIYIYYVIGVRRSTVRVLNPENHLQLYTDSLQMSLSLLSQSLTFLSIKKVTSVFLLY